MTTIAQAFNPQYFAEAIHRDGTSNAFAVPSYPAYVVAYNEMTEIIRAQKVPSLTTELQAIAVMAAPYVDAIAFDDVFTASPNENYRATRCIVLEAARLWFTERLHEQFKPDGVLINWLKDIRVKQ